LVANEGKIFEHSIKQSAEEQHIWFLRIKDVNLPMSIRSKVKLPQNQYDSVAFYKGHLFPLEFKSTKAKSFSLSNKIIKENQIINLQKAAQFDDVIPGFIFNFREPNNLSYFVHINNFIIYTQIAQGKMESIYSSKVNQSSIPIGVIKEVGIPIRQAIKRTNYRYYINQLFDELIHTYESNGNRTTSSSHKGKITGDEGK
jgi:penicillin-binding protein-related factor A (putative recombinase)